MSLNSPSSVSSAPRSVVPEGRVNVEQMRLLGGAVRVLVFDDQLAATSTMYRFQEHYESPEFKGKVFSEEDFVAWYKLHPKYGKPDGGFHYFTDWNGFNFPSSNLAPFFEGKFPDLTVRERQVLAELADVVGAEPSPYVIAVHRKYAECKELVIHECAHALFGVDASYREAVRAELAKHDLSAMEAELAGRGYCGAVLEDEKHAFSIDRDHALTNPAPQALSDALRKIFLEKVGREALVEVLLKVGAKPE